MPISKQMATTAKEDVQDPMPLTVKPCTEQYFLVKKVLHLSCVYLVSIIYLYPYAFVMGPINVIFAWIIAPTEISTSKPLHVSPQMQCQAECPA